MMYVYPKHLREYEDAVTNAVSDLGVTEPQKRFLIALAMHNFAENREGTDTQLREWLKEIKPTLVI
jgi:hypothetical protein